MARNPSISLTDHQQQFIASLVGSGRYHGVSEVVREGLRLLEEREERRLIAMQRFEAAIAEGLASGDSSPLGTVDELIAKAESSMQKDQI